MVKKEEVLNSAPLLSILPVLSPSVVENLVVDLERASRELGKRRDNGLREVAVAIRSFQKEAKTKEDRLDAELTIDCR